MIRRILRFFGFYNKTEESLVLLEERAQHLRKHISTLYERIDRIEHAVDKLISYVEKK